MPELPEVETIVRALRPRLRGRRIVAFESRWARQVTPAPGELTRRLRGRHIADVARRGKYVIWRFESGGGVLLIHLRMSGRFDWLDAATGPEPPHVRAVFRLDDGRRLLLCDARKFARIAWCQDLAELESRIGVDAASRGFTPERLARLLAGIGPNGRAAGRSRPLRRRIKPLLLDQSLVAGLGNIYADEALFRAGIHPLTPADRIGPAQVRRLHAAIRDALHEGIRRNGASIDWVYPGGRMQQHFRVYGRAGEPCVRCGTPIEYLRVAQRGTHVCPRCQPPARRRTPRPRNVTGPVGDARP